MDGQNSKRAKRLGLAGSVLAIFCPVSANAQSLHPMRAEAKSVTDQFAIRVFPGNPYQHRIKVEIHVYDETFREIEAQVVPREALIAPQEFRNVMVVVPFDGKTERRVRNHLGSDLDQLLKQCRQRPVLHRPRQRQPTTVSPIQENHPGYRPSPTTPGPFNYRGPRVLTSVCWS